MSIVEDRIPTRAERKARLVRLGIRGPSQNEVRRAWSETTDLLADIKEDKPDAMAEWVKRQKAVVWELEARVQERVHETPTVAEIQYAVCDYFKVDRMDILSARRTMEIAHPRQIAYYLCKALTLRSLPDIGRKFGGRDHTTVLHGVRKIKLLVRLNWEVAHDVAHIEAALLS
jgi:hypothetical protein